MVRVSNLQRKIPESRTCKLIVPRQIEVRSPLLKEQEQYYSQPLSTNHTQLGFNSVPRERGVVQEALNEDSEGANSSCESSVLIRLSSHEDRIIPNSSQDSEETEGGLEPSKYLL